MFYAKESSNHFICIISFHPHNNLLKYYHHLPPLFADKKAEAQGGEVICPNSHRYRVTEWDLNPVWLQSPPCWHHITAPGSGKLCFLPFGPVCPSAPSGIFTVPSCNRPCSVAFIRLLLLFSFSNSFFPFGDMTKACGISRDWTQCSAVRTWSRNHWTTREFFLSFLGTVFSVLCINHLF